MRKTLSLRWPVTLLPVGFRPFFNCKGTTFPCIRLSLSVHAWLAVVGHKSPIMFLPVVPVIPNRTGIHLMLCFLCLAAQAICQPGDTGDSPLTGGSTQNAAQHNYIITNNGDTLVAEFAFYSPPQDDSTQTLVAHNLREADSTEWTLDDIRGFGINGVFYEAFDSRDGSWYHPGEYCLEMLNGVFWIFVCNERLHASPTSGTRRFFVPGRHTSNGIPVPARKPSARNVAPKTSY